MRAHVLDGKKCAKIININFQQLSKKNLTMAFLVTPWISVQVLSFLLLLLLSCFFYVYVASLSSLSATESWMFSLRDL